MDKYDVLKLDNQLGFPLYACSKELIKQFRPILEGLDLTYTQYITMSVLWEHKSMNVKEMGDILFLDSGTLTPVLKSLEAKGLVTRQRSKNDERVLEVGLTKEGLNLRDNALDIPTKMNGCVTLPTHEKIQLTILLRKMLGAMSND